MIEEMKIELVAYGGCGVPKHLDVNVLDFFSREVSREGKLYYMNDRIFVTVDNHYKYHAMFVTPSGYIIQTQSQEGISPGDRIFLRTDGHVSPPPGLFERYVKYVNDNRSDFSTSLGEPGDEERMAEFLMNQYIMTRDGKPRIGEFGYLSLSEKELRLTCEHFDRCEDSISHPLLCSEIIGMIGRDMHQNDCMRHDAGKWENPDRVIAWWYV